MGKWWESGPATEVFLSPSSTQEFFLSPGSPPHFISATSEECFCWLISALLSNLKKNNKKKKNLFTKHISADAKRVWFCGLPLAGSARNVSLAPPDIFRAQVCKTQTLGRFSQGARSLGAGAGVSPGAATWRPPASSAEPPLAWLSPSVCGFTDPFVPLALPLLLAGCSAVASDA